MVRKIFTFRTKKTPKGFRADIQQITPRKTPNKSGFFADTKTISSATFPTRARALGASRRAVGRLRKIR